MGQGTLISDAYGEISRAQWEDYKARYQPLEQEYIDQIGNKDQQAKELARGVELTTESNQSAYGATLRDAQRTGGLTAEQERAFRKRTLLRSAANIADTTNNMRSAFKERDLEMGGKMIGVGRGLASDANAGFSNLSGLEASRNAANDAQNTAERGQNMATAGVIAGAAIVVF